MSPACRILAVLAAFLVVLVLCSGCSAASRAGLRPSYLEAAYVHQSHPMAGPGPEPIGGPGPDTNFDGIVGTARWERGRLFWDGSVLYQVQSGYDRGGPWVAQFRFGIKVPL